MKLFRHSRLAVLACVLSSGLAPSGVLAQEVVQAPTPYADELASEMRLLAANPADVGAMVRAGELTLKLDDPTAAAGFFARAERIDPNNPRIKAGKGVLLVEAGRPGEALRRFAEAERLRGDVRSFQADRALAYDLIGEQERAQRDYRSALRDAPSDETIRRYALSLGISGKREEALNELDPLLRRSDRAAWRARAFILAMTGDPQGASRIATSMMPGGLAQGLQPFFQRLPQLGAVDRAFAVHFGEVRGTPERVADARLAPPLPYLAPEPGRQVILASAVQPESVATGKKSKKDRKKRGKDRIEVATIAPPRPLPQPPAYVGPPIGREVVQAIPGRSEIAQPLPGRTVVAQQDSSPPAAKPLPPVALAANRPVTLTALPVQRRDEQPATTRPIPEQDTRVSVAPPVQQAAQAGNDDSGDSVDDGGDVDVVEPVPTTVAAPRPVAAVPEEQAPTPVVRSENKPAHSVAVAPEPPPPVAGGSEDSILAKIIANITVPGSELGVDPVETAPAPVKLAEAAPEKLESKSAAAARQQPDAATQAALAEQKAADKIANDKKLADKKLADKKIADKKLADAKAAELKKKNDPKILEPSRIWVQVAGGANESTLPKEWARVRDKAPAAFKGKSGWTTPLRLTNRVLAGPFKTDAEARAFVNLLAKSDISGFTFTSEAGQKITKLPAK